ncbi:winged helix-turn-helix transcriptional regulator [Roseibium marinum]|uniref:DNA-binding HxlR family transcriptional regulator n=1 Tax=Roseibium marinum TaxID=281252 RepID=A0A2S3V2U6_9HYPH|nr:helix-turn-helix domain-containing protein [Roseibium marinum]POF34225.1 DNA-binding HxlR family transcriptional regulator [Roseibium marinum]
MNTKPEDNFPFICGLDAALRVIGGKWKPLVLYFLRKGPMRYGELQRSVRGVSDKVLIQQLKELEAHGIVLRTDHREIPPRVDYTLTPLGCSLADALTSLCGWGEKHSATIAAALAGREKEGVG